MTYMLHAVRDEDGGIDGLIPGDQDKKEVRRQQYYARNDKGVAWGWVLRARDPQLAERIAHNMELIVDNDNIGYSQKHRMDWYNSTFANGGDITKARGDGDCSSTVTGSTVLAGGNVPKKLATKTMLSAFKASKQFDVLTDAIYLQSSDYLRRGDILLRIGHTAVIADDGPKAWTTETPADDEDDKLPTGPVNRMIVDEKHTFEGVEYGVKEWCRVRKGPSLDDDILGKAYLGEIYDAYALVEDWILIDYKGRPGYIYKIYLSEVGS